MMDTSTPLILSKIKLEDKEPISEIKKWFALLQKERGWRAELRRADVPESLLLCAGFRALVKPFRGWVMNHEWKWFALAIATGVAAHVKQMDDSASFASQLGKPKKGSKNPPLSAMRFSRLNQAHDHDEFYRLMIRAVRQLDGKVNLISMIDGIFLWCREQYETTNPVPFERSPFQRPALRWATEYFQATEMIED